MRRHIIITSGRSGSNALVELLNGHPQIVNYGEVLGEWMPSSKLHQRVAYGGATWERYLDHCLRSRLHFRLATTWSAVARTRRGQRRRHKRWADVETIGVKEFSDHFIGYHLQDYLDDRPDIRVVHLRRSNIVERALSVVRLRHTGTVANLRDGAAPPFCVPLGQFHAVLQDLELGDAREDLLVDRLEPQRVHKVGYEDLFTSAAPPDGALQEIFAFLGVKPDVAVQGTHRRVTAPRLHASIANADELVELLRGTRYESMLQV